MIWLAPWPAPSGFTIWRNRRKISYTGCSGPPPWGCLYLRGQLADAAESLGQALPRASAMDIWKPGSTAWESFSLCAMRQGDRERAVDAAERVAADGCADVRP